MSEKRMTLEDAIQVACGGEHHNKLSEADTEEGRLLSELRSLRAAQEECDELKKNSDEHYKRVLFYKKKYESLFNGFSEYIDNPEQFVAEVEAWRAVRERSDARESHYKVHHEVLRQIARLDAMKEGK